MTHQRNYRKTEAATLASLSRAVNAPLSQREAENVGAGLAANGDTFEDERVEDSPPPATEKQMAFINDLLGQVELTDEQNDHVNRQLDYGLSVSQASAWIDRLLELRKSAPALRESNGSGFADIPAGRYAITGQDGSTDFYRVDRPTEGRWAGYTFVKLELGGGGEVRQSLANSKSITHKIVEAGPQDAMERYGRELGHCGHCGRTLTNETSRARGIGPVCAGKMGWGE